MLTYGGERRFLGTRLALMVVVTALLLAVVLPAGQVTLAQDGETGTIHAWGDDNFGQLSDTPTEDRFVAVSAGGRHSLALQHDGTIVAWGHDRFPNPDYVAGQVSDTPTEGGFVAVSAGWYHSLALREDGTIAAWGDNSVGQVGGTPTEIGFVAMSAGASHALAIWVAEPDALDPIEQAVIVVEKLEVEGVLNQGQSRSLTTKLNIATAQINDGKLKPACNLLRAFINDVQALIAAGTLSQGQGEELIELAEAAIALAGE